MASLEDLTVGSSVGGHANNEAVQIFSVKWFGDSVLEVVYKDSSGNLGNELLYRDDEARLDVWQDRLPWSFDADGNDVQLASEAYQINLAHLFDPFLAIRTSSIEPLPRQISAVYQEMLPCLPLRYVLADDLTFARSISTNSLAKMGKDESVAMESLAKNCVALDCTLDDIVEIQNDVEKGGA